VSFAKIKQEKMEFIVIVKSVGQIECVFMQKVKKGKEG